MDKEICGARLRSVDSLDHLLWAHHEIMDLYWDVFPGAVCIDAGFGPGGWTLVALAKGASVIAFDPKPLCVEILTQLLAVNDFDHCTIVQAGLWKSTGTIPFGVNGFKEPEMGNSAPVYALDDYADAHPLDRLDFFAMDVEDSELEVVMGAKRTIKRLRPRLVIESHGEESAGILREELKILGNYTCERHQEFLVAIPG